MNKNLHSNVHIQVQSISVHVAHWGAQCCAHNFVTHSNELHTLVPWYHCVHSIAHSGAHFGAHSFAHFGAHLVSQCDAHCSSTAHAVCSFGGMSYVRLDGETQGCLGSARGDCFYPSPQSQMPQFRFEFSESETNFYDNLMNV